MVDGLAGTGRLVDLVGQLLVEESLPVQPLLEFTYSLVDAGHFQLPLTQDLPLLVQPQGLLLVQFISIL